MSHQNVHGDCDKCDQIFDAYPNFYAPLRVWFASVRGIFFDAHISCAGRGKIDQQAFYHRGASNAQWTQSAHNWNAAIDVWQLDPTKIDHYALDRAWFTKVFEACPIGTEFKWYGAVGARYPELPHIEATLWREMAQAEELRLVE